MADFLVHMRGGKIQNMEDVRRVFAQLRDGWHKVKATQHKDRSLPQNAYFHGVVLPLILEGLRNAGWEDMQTIEDAKVIIKNLFCQRSTAPNTKTGEVFTFIQDTHLLTTVEFNELIDRCIQFGAQELGVQIPYPNEYYNP